MYQYGIVLATTHAKIPIDDLNTLHNALVLNLRAKGLIVSRDGRYVGISAPVDLLHECAEKLGIQKITNTGHVVPFNRRIKSKFPDVNHPTHFFTSREKIDMIVDILESLVTTSDDEIFAQAGSELGSPLLHFCFTSGIVTDHYPVHDPVTVEALRKDWLFSLIKSQPLDELAAYYGEKVAMYFAWTGEYTRFLIIPGVLGVIIQFTQRFSSIAQYTLVLYAVLLAGWATVFLEAWRRRSSELALQWQTIHFAAVQKPRPEFEGILAYNTITEQLERTFDPDERNKIYAFTIPATLAMIGFVLSAMVGSFWATDYLEGTSYASLPSLFYSVCIPIFNKLYTGIATKFNDMENYRTDSEYENALIFRLFSFQFLNCYCSLFWIAFVRRDWDTLEKQLFDIMLMYQVIFALVENLTPPLMKLWTAYSAKKEEAKLTHSNRSLDPVVKEFLLTPYPNTYGDFLEMVLQYGYVVLFGVAYPPMALFALLNNVVELKTDALAMLYSYRRPFPRKADSIGSWYTILNFLAILSVVTNFGIVGYTDKEVKILGSDQWHKFLAFVAIEHVVLFVKMGVHFIVPGRPRWVHEEILRTQYRMKKFYEENKIAEFEPNEALPVSVLDGGEKGSLPSGIQSVLSSVPPLNSSLVSELQVQEPIDEGDTKKDR